MKKDTGIRAIRLIAAWDLLLTLPFAIPLVNARLIEALSLAHGLISPRRPFPAFDGLHLFFVTLFGIMAVLWAIVRMQRPSRYLALSDTIGRAVVAIVMISFTALGGSAVPALFSLSEICLGIVQAVVLARMGRED
ncbi:MAG TPA: hypothetical protein PLU93_09020 [Treponemataceae bacterium]|nr:hypothetical protein [Treponemataceae bacterium]